MSATGSEPSLRKLVDEVMALLADEEENDEEENEEPAEPVPPVPRYGRLHETAAVQDWFDPETIQPAPGAGELETIDELLANSTQTYDGDGTKRWTLALGIRVAVLRQLRERGRVQAALSASMQQPDGSRGTLQAYLQGTPEAIEDHSLSQLAASFEACEWLRAAGFEGLPERDALQRRIDWLTLLEPFEHLAGSSFRGRTEELRRLRSYADVLAPAPEKDDALASRRQVPHRGQKPPLLIYGPGGVGKSTLLARFILEHAQALERDRFPFAYLDFDRPDVDASEPLTLLIEALRQFAIEYPQARIQSQRIREGWTDLLIGAQQSSTELREKAPESLTARARSAAVHDFARLIETIGANDRPVVFVLDTFEDVQLRSDEDVAAVWTLLEQLQSAVNRLRVCIAGRGQIPGREAEELPLTGLDEEAAVGYLLARGVSDSVVARRIARQVGGNPMSLKLAADLVRQEGLSGEQLDVATREFLYVRVDDSVIQRQLYKRILGHIRNPDVRKIAHPGLVLRRLTPELILEALAVPCDLTIDSLDEARELFRELKREVSLVTVASDGALEHRPDLRLLMLRLLEAEEPDRAQAIRELAVRHYERRTPEPPERERAEEIYLRLALGQSTEDIERRWISGVEPYLTAVLPEFSGVRRAYLASRLGVAVDEETRRRANLEDWERLTERKARDLLAQEQPREVLDLLTVRDDRTPASPLVGLQATALAQLGRWQESMAVLEDGIDRAITHGERLQALDLALQQAEVALASASTGDAPRLLSRLEWLTESSPAPADRLNAIAHRLALGQLAPPSPEATAELHSELRRLFDGVPDEVLGNDPALARWAGSLFGAEDLSRLSRVLRTSGLPRTDTSALRSLASAIASSDRSHSQDIGEPPGFLARELNVTVDGSLTGSWGQFLLTAADTAVSTVLIRLLDDYTSFVSPELIDGLAMVFRSALGVERPSSRASRDAIVGSVSRRQPMALTAPALNELHTALLSAFDSENEVRGVLLFRLDRSLDAIAPPGGSFSTVLFRLISVAQAEGWLDKLIVTAREARPANTELARVAEQLGLPTLVPGDPTVIDRIAAAQPGLDIATWRERLGLIEGQVCRVEVGGRVAGTGFLVGADLVLTADHVLAPVNDGGMPLREVVLRFDHKTDRSGRIITPGTEFELERILARSDYGQGADQLGYSLLRVAGYPGAQPIGDLRTEASGALRQWIDVPISPPYVAPGDGLAMVQHPRGQQLTLTINSHAVAGLSEDGTRIRYDLAAEPGSSGAPCFTLDLELAAFHIGISTISPASPRPTAFGILISAVQQDLREKGMGDLLGTVFA